jgi:hypothetical protein
VPDVQGSPFILQGSSAVNGAAHAEGGTIADLLSRPWPARRAHALQTTCRVDRGEAALRMR